VVSDDLDDRPDAPPTSPAAPRSRRGWRQLSMLDRKLLRELYAARGLLLAIILILGLGVSAYVANLSLYYNLEYSRRSYYAQSRMADFWIDIEKLPHAELDRVRGVRGVSELRPRIMQTVRVDLPQVERPLAGTILSMPAEPRPVINNLVMRRGSYFTQERREEVIVSDTFATYHGIRPGDRLHILLNDRRQELFVVGTAIGAEFVFARPPGAMIPDASGYVVLFVKEQFAEEITNLQGAANQLVGLLTPEFKQQPRRVLDQVERRLEPIGEATSTPLAEHGSHLQLTSDLQSLRTVNLVVPSVFLAVAALILDVLMVRITQQQRTLVGMLKAIGYSNGQLLGHFLKFGAVVGGCGGLLGAGFGYWLAGYILGLFRRFYEFPRMINQPYPGIVAACVLLSMAMAMLGTLRGAWQVMRLRPAEAMRPRPPEVGRRVFLEHWTWLWRRLGFRWQMVLRGIVRHRLRVFTGVFASMMGAGLILQTQQLDDSFHELLQFTFEKLMVSDMDLTFKSEVDYGGYLEARRLPGVDQAEPLLAVACTFHQGHHSKRSTITGLRQGARLTVPRNTRGQVVPIPDEGLVLTRRLAEILHVKAGGTVEFVPLKGERRRIRAQVAQVVESYVGTDCYARDTYLNRLVGEQQAVSVVQAKLQPGAEVSREFYRALKATPRLEGYSALREQKVQLETLLKPLKVVNKFLIAFAGLLFCGGIVTSSLISLAERRQEIATLRVLGYQPRQVGGIFLRESLIVNSIGITLGLPVGYAFAYYINYFVGTDITRLPFVLERSTWAMTVLLGILFTGLGYLPVYRAVRRLDWIGALNVNE
jgi:putative ABC transport system permease protein